MQFEWDEKKRKSNLKKHGVDFNEVKEVFNHPMLTSLDTRHDYGEDRWIGIGINRGKVVVVAFSETDERTVRIISARRANRYEEASFQKQIQGS